jgi:hypothetical protein
MTTEVHLNLNELVDRIALPKSDPRQLQLVLDLILIAASEYFSCSISPLQFSIRIAISLNEILVSVHKDRNFKTAIFASSSVAPNIRISLLMRFASGSLSDAMNRLNSIVGDIDTDEVAAELLRGMQRHDRSVW